MLATSITILLCIFYWWWRLEDLYCRIPRWKISLVLLIPVVLSYSYPLAFGLCLFVHEMYRFGLYLDANQKPIIDALNNFFFKARYYYKGKTITIPAEFIDGQIWAVTEYNDKIYIFSEEPKFIPDQYENSWVGQNKTEVGHSGLSVSRQYVRSSLEKVK